jgi:recombination protein RecR
LYCSRQKKSRLSNLFECGIFRIRFEKTEAPTVSRYAEPMARLIEELKKLPGVGAKSAQRLAFHILRASDEDAAALAEAVRGLKASLRLCSVCNNVTDIDPCAYCTNAARNQRLVCVVEEPTSIEAVERTRSSQGGYQGVYHVLHGSLSPLHGVGPDQLRINTLVGRVERGEVDEVILATSPTLEGEATAHWLATALRGFPVRITRIATGVPAGSDIEYADEVTMSKALEGRREL